MNLTTTTPTEIDAKLADLYYAECALQAKVGAAMTAIHRGLGERQESSGRGAARREWWPTSDTDALAAMRAKGDTLIGMMRTAASIVAKYDEAVAAFAANHDQQAPLHAEFVRRGGWTRFFEVSGGHIHRDQNCSTLHRGKERTRLGWLIEMSGTDEAQAIAELAAAAHVLCSVCIPGAPVAATPALRKTAAEKAAAREAAERKARTEDPKLIADVDGSPLRIDGAVVRTVRSAEIAGVDALSWAAYGRHVGEPNEARAAELEDRARTVAAALAAKNGTTPDSELARLTEKAITKVRRDLGAEVATAAAAVWAVQVDAAALASGLSLALPGTLATTDVDGARVEIGDVVECVGSLSGVLTGKRGLVIRVGHDGSDGGGWVELRWPRRGASTTKRSANRVRALDRAAEPVRDGNGEAVLPPDGMDADELRVFRMFMAGRVPAKHCPHYIAVSEDDAGYRRCEQAECRLGGGQDEPKPEQAFRCQPEQQHAARDSDAALDTLISNARTDMRVAPGWWAGDAYGVVADDLPSKV